MNAFRGKMFHPRKSLSQRLRTGLACMLLPLMATIAVTFFSQNLIISHLDEIVEESTEEIGPVLNMHQRLHEVMMPPHDYLIHGRKEVEQEDYAVLAAAVDDAFGSALDGPFALHEEYAKVRDAKLSWEQARTTGWKIFNDTKGQGDPRAMDLMEDFDRQLEQTQALIEQFYSHASHEIREAQGEVQQVRKLSHTLITGMLAAGLGLAFWIGLALSRSILRPVKILTSGTAKLARGNLCHRVEMERGDEFGTLADAFNYMAEELEKIQATLEQLSFQDELTGLYNRRRFRNDLAEEIERANRYDHGFALALIDIDHFKRVNDRFGHPVGDRVLREVAQCLRTTVRDSDRLARIGGEEFAIILPESDLPHALEAAERIRARTADLCISIDREPPLQITVSLGVAVCPGQGGDADEIFRMADRALYQAKEQGRNRVCHHSSEKPSATIPSTTA